MSTVKMTDDDLMPFGIHRGKALVNIPADYFIFLYENNRCGAVKQYIEDNLETLKIEAASQKRRNKRK